MSERMPEATAHQSGRSGPVGPPGHDDEAAGAGKAGERELAPPPKGPLDPNDGKSLTLDVDGATWARIPVRTELFARGDDLEAKVASHVEPMLPLVQDEPRLASGLEQRWYVVVSEKIVAISQGRSYFTWEINPGLPARVLARFVHRTPYGIGLGSPWTMQLAVNEAGLPRIVAAAAASLVGKLLGRRGWFYRVAGHRVNAIDGPTPYSAYPSNVSAKLPPKDPAAVAARVSTALRAGLPEALRATFGGTVVIDSNDLGRDVLGQDTDRDDAFFAALFADNPFGQGRQQTPLAVCLRLS